jgi:hypothetical protein
VHLAPGLLLCLPGRLVLLLRFCPSRAAGRSCLLSAVASDSTVIITCAKPATYTPGTATVTVTATAGGTSCSDDGSGFAIVTIDPKPTVDITGPESGAVSPGPICLCNLAASCPTACICLTKPAFAKCLSILVGQETAKME